MKSIKIFLVLIGIVSHALAQDILLKKAPLLSLKSMLQVPGNKQWQNSIGGQIVVLEFWATWCTPCMANVEHLNKLSKHFADSNVQFISITDEPEGKIREFLKKRKMVSWVGIDSGGKTFRDYGVTGMPATFVLDKEGVIKYAGQPGELNELVIRGIIAGTYQPERIKIKEEEMTLGGFSGGVDPVFTAHFNPKTTKILHQTIIRQSVGAVGMARKGGKGSVGITLLGRSLPAIISFTDELASAYRVINRSSVNDTSRWDAIFTRSKGYDMPKALKELRETALSSFSIAIKDSIVSKTVITPSFSGSSNVMDEKNIDFDKAETHSYRSLKNLYNIIEEKSGEIIDYSPQAETQYIDIFEIISGFYKMPGIEIKGWLEKHGFTFKQVKKDMLMKVVYND